MTAEEMKRRGIYVADPMSGASMPMSRFAKALQSVDLGEKHAAPGRAAMMATPEPDVMPQMPDTPAEPAPTNTPTPKIDIRSLFDSLPTGAQPAIAPASRRRRRRQTTPAEPPVTETLETPAAVIPPASDLASESTPLPAPEETEPVAPTDTAPTDATPTDGLPAGADVNKAAFAWDQPAEPNPLPADEQNKAVFAWEKPVSYAPPEWRSHLPQTLTPEPYTKKGGQPYASYISKRQKLLEILSDKVKDPEILNAAKMAFDRKSAGMLTSTDSLMSVVKGAITAQQARNGGGAGTAPHATTLDPKQEAIFEKSLEDQAKQISDPQVRMEAFRVALDKTMNPEDRQKAFASYLSSFPKQSVGVLGKAERYMAKIDQLSALPNSTPAQRRRLKNYHALLTKEQSVAMSDLSKKQKDLAKIKTGFVNTLPTAIRSVPLSELDTRTLTPAQQAQASKVGAWSIKAMGLRNATFDKDIANITTQRKQATNAMDYTLKALSSGKEFNALNRKKRDLLSDYTGLSGDDISRSFRDKQVMSLFSKYRHGLYGGQLSKTEKPEFEKEASTLYHSNSDLGLAIQSIMSNNLARLDGIRTVLTPEVFNLKYGALYRNLNEMNEANARALQLATGQGGRKRRIRIIGGQATQDVTPSSRSSRTIPQTPPAASPQSTEPKPIGKKDMGDGRIAVKYDDGSIHYYAK